MAWNPFSKPSPQAAPDKGADVVPVLDASTASVGAFGLTEDAPAAVPQQSSALRDAFEQAQRELGDAEAQPAVADAVVGDPAPTVDPAAPAAAASPAPLRFGGATRFGGPAPTPTAPVDAEVADATDGATPAAPPSAPAAPAAASASPWEKFDEHASDAPSPVDGPSPADAPTAVIAPVVAAPAASVAASVAADRHTAVLPAASADDLVTAEQARLERERAARREARLAALEPVAEDDPLAAKPAPTAVAPVKLVKHPTDKFFGSLGLFALRLVTAAILFVHGLNGIINSKPIVDLWTNTVLPYPRYIALGVSVAELAIAILLVFGLLTRFAGLLLAGLMGATLAFVMWGPWSVFDQGGQGFLGEHELLLAAVGLLFLLVGAGGWSVDYAMRRGRAREGLDF